VSQDAVPDRSAPRVVVAVLTFRRPAQLRRLLPLLAEQAASIDPPAAVLVVDNDPAGSAAGDVAAGGPAGPRYVHEPRPGIAAARNRALSAAAGYDALVFIDDDELPGTEWLATLVRSWREWGCAAVSGPVCAQFPDPPPAWVRASRAFDRRRRPSGSVVLGAPTNNLLLDLAVVNRLGLRFDDRFGLTGGEDTMFSRALRRGGGEIRWCDEAEVIEPVAPERATRRWVLRREYRAGTSWSAVELALAGTRTARAGVRVSLAARAVARIGRALVRTAIGRATRDVDRQAPADVEIVACTGMLLGAAGVTFREYRRR